MIKLSKNLFLTFILCLVAGSLFAQSKLPPCQGDLEIKWSNCFGSSSSGDGSIKYSGDYKNGKANGFGVLTIATGDKYEGQFKDDQFNGKGVYSHANGDVYSGQYKNGARNGLGTSLYSNGDKYTGQYKDGVINGQGTYTWANGNQYIGENRSDGSSGNGVLTTPDGRKEKAHWKNGELFTESKNENKSKSILQLSCMTETGGMQGADTQYLINLETSTIASSRGKTQPENVRISDSLISFTQGDVYLSINRISGRFSGTYNGKVLVSGSCQSIDQVKPKF